MRDQRIFFFIISLCLSTLLILSSAFAAPKEKKEYVCGLLAQEPVLDGKVKGDPAWEGSLREGGRFVMLGNDIPASRQTYFRIGYTTEALFIGIECEEPTIKGIKAKLQDMGPLYDEDSVEIFVFPEGSEEYVQFVVNAIGSRWNGVRSGAPQPLLDWQAKTCIGEDFWSSEIRIPWKILSSIPKEKEKWRMNICRNILSGGKHERVNWAPTIKSFHEPESFGWMVFSDKVFLKERQGKEKEIKNIKKEIFLYSKPLAGTYLQKGFTAKKIAYIQGPYIAPRISPNKKSVLLHSKRGGEIGVWVTNEKGEQMERICDGDQAEWSPNGKKIVFRREGRIIERELASGNERNITSNDSHCFGFASYLPDERIIFVEKNEKIFSVEPRGENNLQLLAEGEITSTPKCSPDGKKIAYSDGAHIYIMDVAEKKVTQLTTAGGVQAWPMWSTDSKSICFSQSREAFGGPWDIYHLKLENPQTLGLVIRDRDVSPDWRGLSPSTSLKTQVKGSNIDLRQEDSWQIQSNVNRWM